MATNFIAKKLKIYLLKVSISANYTIKIQSYPLFARLATC
jgi:hypothetical protein